MLRIGDRLDSSAELDFVFLFFNVIRSGAFGVDDARLVASCLSLEEIIVFFHNFQ